METTAEQIKKLEQELAALKEKERKEKEEAQKKAEAERDADLLAIMDSIKAFNKKHGENIALSTASNSKSAQGLYDLLFPWFGD
jgi:molecular chaperone GrpE (heat shock protein)